MRIWMKGKKKSTSFLGPFDSLDFDAKLNIYQFFVENIFLTKVVLLEPLKEKCNLVVEQK